MSAHPTRRLALMVAGLTLVSLTSLGAAPAVADEAADAPVTTADRLTLHVTPEGGSGRQLDVLANDTDPNGDDLEICRVVVPEDSPLTVRQFETYREPDPESGGSDLDEVPVEVLDVQAFVSRATTATFTYYACDRDYLTPATVTVTLEPVPPVRARKVAGKLGRVRFTNPGDLRVVVLYGGPHEEEPDGRLRLAPGASRTIRVQRPRLVFVAFLPRTGALINTGRVRGIRQHAYERPAAPTQHAAQTGANRRDERLWRSVR
ncbi:hypothetical protein [Nocardioides sp.]|uniref:Ig-like domain-containing protein n=1 Tax=Nocardioides sp. TaxID=35761 RepID=UPI002718F831|nr:hypothetical protein [Nocardioides sp.]MDO9455804.1 hypothetical protein [Nocardioides sp.]